MSAAPDDAGVFARLNDDIQLFYARNDLVSMRHAAARALEAACTAQRAAHARTYPGSEHGTAEVIELPVTGSGGLAGADLALRATAVKLATVLYNTVASDGAHCLDPASEMTLLRIRGDLWQHLAGPYPPSPAHD
jgi:hypothetical protein